MDLEGASFAVDLPKETDAYDEKYILVHVVEKNQWLVVSRRRRFHAGIFEEWRMGYALDHHTYNVHGGGILCIRDGKVKTYGSSGGFGIVSPQGLEIVRKCLETTNLEIDKIEASDYIRE